MPKSSKRELATKAKYNKKPSVQKKRVANNKARREALRDGRVKKGDGKDVHHVGHWTKVAAQRSPTPRL